MHFIFMSFMALFLTIFTGCSSKDVEAQKPIPTVFDTCVIRGVEAPKWVCGDETAQNINQLHDVGSATISKLGVGFTQKEALAEGQIKLKTQIEELAHEKIVLFIRKSQIDDEHNIDKLFVIKTSKKIATKAISKSRVSEYWKNYYLNQAYAQVVIKKSTFTKVAKREILLEIRENLEYWQAFKDKNATSVLDKVLSDI